MYGYFPLRFTKGRVVSPKGIPIQHNNISNIQMFEEHKTKCANKYSICGLGLLRNITVKAFKNNNFDK